MAKKTIPVIKQDDQKPVPIEILAQQIGAIADGIKKLRSGPIKDDTLVLLIQNACPSVKGSYSKPTITEIRSVLDGIENLRRAHLK
jgi:hypothetical protein